MATTIVESPPSELPTTMPPRGEIDFTRQESVEDLLTSEATNDDFRMKRDDLEALRELPGNRYCIDCANSDPEWCSLNVGIFFCLECSGSHRALGTHVSFVRSVEMDSWSNDQLEKMRIGGNFQCLEFLGTHGIDFADATIKERYSCPPAQLYQQVLKARREGKPEPTELPKMPQQPTVKKIETMGFGSTPVPNKPPVIVTNTVGLFRKMKRISEDYTKDLELPQTSLGTMVREFSSRSLSSRSLLAQTTGSDSDEAKQVEEVEGDII